MQPGALAPALILLLTASVAAGQDALLPGQVTPATRQPRAAIMGRVLDDVGDGVEVAAGFTDDRGMYRLSIETGKPVTVATGCPRAAYYVTPLATPPDGGADAWQHPAVLDAFAARAASVVLGESGEASVALVAP